jgi:hypothetical protein
LRPSTWPNRLREVTTQLATAEAELARVQAALSALAAAPPPPRAARPVEPPPRRPTSLLTPAVEDAGLLLPLVQQAQQYAGSVRVTELTWELGQLRVHEPHFDPYTVLRLHVVGKRLWWRLQLPHAVEEWVCTNACWVGTDARIWVELEPQLFVVVAEVAPAGNPDLPAPLIVQAPPYAAPRN